MLVFRASTSLQAARQLSRAFGGGGFSLLAATFAEYGPPEKLTVGEIPRPTLGAGELLVRVAAAGLNPIDCRIRSGELRHFLRVGLPFVSGSDIAGIVEAAGP